MPSTRARTCATRYGDVRPGSSIEIGTLPRWTVTTETCAGFGVVAGAGLAGPQAARTRLVNARAMATRNGVLGSDVMRPPIRQMAVTGSWRRSAAHAFHIGRTALH